MQFATLFQLLHDGRPMVEFPSRFELYKYLNMPDLPNIHRTDGAGWLMVEHIYFFCSQEDKGDD